MRGLPGGVPRASTVDDDTRGLVRGRRITREEYERLRDFDFGVPFDAEMPANVAAP